MRYYLSLLIYLLAFDASAQVDRLAGTWRLVSYTSNTVDASGVTTSEHVFGKAAAGFLTYGRDGRMSAILTKENRTTPADPKRPTEQGKRRFNQFPAVLTG
jgi:hypothetical protein